jgi:hypothetical protein
MPHFVVDCSENVLQIIRPKRFCAGFTTQRKRPDYLNKATLKSELARFDITLSAIQNLISSKFSAVLWKGARPNKKRIRPGKL